MSETLQHTRSCPALTPGNYEECTCGLRWRIELQTEREMHNAWRKRAEEAEAAAPPADETLPAGEKTRGAFRSWADNFLFPKVHPSGYSKEMENRVVCLTNKLMEAAQPREAQAAAPATTPNCLCGHSQSNHVSVPAHPGQLAGCQDCNCPQFAQAAAPSGKEPTIHMPMNSGPAPTVVNRNQDYLTDLRHDLQDDEYAFLYLSACAMEGGDTLRLGLRDVKEAWLASHPLQDKPPAAPLCGKRIPETGLGCTLEPGHQGRHDVDVTKVSEAPLRKRLEGVLPSIAIRIHAYMSAAQNLPYEEGETCEECEDIARELIELAGQATSEEPPIESTMSMQKACETIAEKEIKKWYSHSEGARAAHNIWSEIRALAARPKEEPK